jgi:hypothetical protein
VASEALQRVAAPYAIEKEVRANIKMTSVRLTNSTAETASAPCVSIHAAQAVPTQFYLNSCLPVYNTIPQPVTDLLH